MNGRERVLMSLDHKEPDKVPLYVWLFDQPFEKEQIVPKYGSANAFLDEIEADMVQLFPAKNYLDASASMDMDEVKTSDSDDSTGEADSHNIFGDVMTLDEALDATFNDPNDDEIYVPIKEGLKIHQEGKGRAVYVQTPSIFESSHGVVGMQQQMMMLAMEPEKLQLLYQKIVDWVNVYSDNLLDLGVDVVHLSDDYGMNNSTLISPKVFRGVIKPYLAKIVGHIRKRSPYASLHSCGYFEPFIEDLIEVGINCIHPFQESSGMDQYKAKEKWGDKLTIYGGLDARTTIYEGLDVIENDVRNKIEKLGKGGGFIFCTGHIVQANTPLESVEYAYKIANEVRNKK